MTRLLLLYGGIAVATLAWRGFSANLAGVCQFNADACAVLALAACRDAALWPLYVLHQVL